MRSVIEASLLLARDCVAFVWVHPLESESLADLEAAFQNLGCGVILDEHGERVCVFSPQRAIPQAIG